MPEHLPLLGSLSFPVLQEMAADGLLTFNREGMQLTETGHYFIRNACSAFDLYLQRNRSITSGNQFSKAI